jgi:DNA-binding response OmpR family regulator
MTDMLPSLTKILIIDDDPDLLLLLNKMLKRIGAETVVAENGESGMALMKAQRFDLLVLDLMLPDIDGYEILKRIRADEELKDLPVLILSARADPDAINRGLEAGANGYLTKPYLPNTLTSRVRAILAEGRRKHRSE